MINPLGRPASHSGAGCLTAQPYRLQTSYPVWPPFASRSGPLGKVSYIGRRINGGGMVFFSSALLPRRARADKRLSIRQPLGYNPAVEEYEDGS